MNGIEAFNHTHVKMVLFILTMEFIHTSAIQSTAKVNMETFCVSVRAEHMRNTITHLIHSNAFIKFKYTVRFQLMFVQL